MSPRADLSRHLEELEQSVGAGPIDDRLRPIEGSMDTDWIQRRMQSGDLEKLRAQLRTVRREVLRRDAPRWPPGAERLAQLREGDPQERQGLEQILNRPQYARRQAQAEFEREMGEQVEGERSAPQGHRRRRPVRKTGPLGSDSGSREPGEVDITLPDWLKGWGLPSFPAWAGTALLWVVCAAILAIVVVGLVRFILHRRQARQTQEAEARQGVPLDVLADADILAATPEEFSLTATRLARDGRYRDAIRALYLELLGRLYQAGFITYDRTRTNWEYAIQLRSREAIHPSFMEFTRTFDRVWYGNVVCGEADYRSCRENVLDISEHLPLS